jgi:hypothetical protein
MRAHRTFFFAIRTRIDVPRQKPAGIGVQPTRRGEINAWVDAEGYHPFRLPKAITEPPPFRTPGHHMKAHAVFVRENVTVLARSRGTHHPRGE